jgi:hypothetical protein
MGSALARIAEGNKSIRVAPTALDLDGQSVNTPIQQTPQQAPIQQTSTPIIPQSSLSWRTRLFEYRESTIGHDSGGGSTTHYTSLERQYATLENTIEL